MPENANATATGDTDYVVFMNFDMDSQESSAASSRTGKALAAPAISGNDVADGTAYNLYDTNQAAPGVTDERNGTWTLTVTEVGAEGIAENSTELWFTLDPNNTVPLGDGELLRAYASPITGPASPDHVTLTYQDGSALANNSDTETIYLQVVDSSGNPLNYSRNIYVTITDANANPATISAISAGTNNSSNALITTDAWGFGYLRVIRNNNGAAPTDEALPVTITAYWNGTGGSNSFGTNTSGTIGVTFYEDPAPTLSSASNLSFTEGSTASLPTITIADSGVNNITTTNEIRIRIPGSLTANFNTTLDHPDLRGRQCRERQHHGQLPDVQDPADRRHQQFRRRLHPDHRGPGLHRSEQRLLRPAGDVLRRRRSPIRWSTTRRSPSRTAAALPTTPGPAPPTRPGPRAPTGPAAPLRARARRRTTSPSRLRDACRRCLRR